MSLAVGRRRNAVAPRDTVDLLLASIIPRVGDAGGAEDMDRLLAVTYSDQVNLVPIDRFASRPGRAATRGRSPWAASIPTSLVTERTAERAAATGNGAL